MRLKAYRHAATKKPPAFASGSRGLLGVSIAHRWAARLATTSIEIGSLIRFRSFPQFGLSVLNRITKPNYLSFRQIGPGWKNGQDEIGMV